MKSIIETVQQIDKLYNFHRPTSGLEYKCENLKPYELLCLPWNEQIVGSCATASHPWWFGKNDPTSHHEEVVNGIICEELQTKYKCVCLGSLFKKWWWWWWWHLYLNLFSHTDTTNTKRSSHCEKRLHFQKCTHSKIYSGLFG